MNVRQKQMDDGDTVGNPLEVEMDWQVIELRVAIA
jgi:hypothetical protein